MSENGNTPVVTPTVAPAAPQYAVKAPKLPATLFVEIKDDQGNRVATFTMPTKDFSTGSKGYYTNGKAAIGWKRYQGQFQLVEIGSKGK